MSVDKTFTLVGSTSSQSGKNITLVVKRTCHSRKTLYQLKKCEISREKRYISGQKIFQPRKLLHQCTKRHFNHEKHYRIKRNANYRKKQNYSREKTLCYRTQLRVSRENF